MNTYNSTRNAKFLLNYHLVWIPKYRNNILIQKLAINIVKDTIEELSHNHMTNLNHKISRKLINLAVQEKLSTIVMENLKTKGI